MKIFVSILMFLVVATFGYFALVSAESHPPQVCGDGIAQTPNDVDYWELCDEGTGNGESPNPVETATCTATCNPKMLGWAWDWATRWISLNSHNCDVANGSYLYLDLDYTPPGICAPQLIDGVPQPGVIDYYVQVLANNSEGTSGNALGWAWSDNIGWICFGTPGDPVCNLTAPDGGPATITLDFSTDSTNPPLLGWAKILSEGDDGWVSLNCENAGTCGTCDAEFCSNGGALCSTDEDCTVSDFKVVYTQATFNTTTAQTLNGWGWNNNDNGEGIGWIQFNPPIGAILPWLQTKYGDIYARGDILGNPIPNTAYNATYRILSGGSVSQFSSLSDDNLFVSPNFGPIDFPTPDTRYSNVLGQLDLDGLIAKSDLITAETEILNLLGGKIYYVDGNLDINSVKQFINGTDFEDGSGTIIVKGNLTINADITYDSTGGTDRFRNLASVAWIVLGDLQINGSVKNLAGNFIVLGDGSDCADGDPTGCGQALSCFPLADCDNRLTVAGLMMAPIFEFDRTFIDPQGVPLPGGSEIIIYDGRLLANTPPGLGDFAKALPIWRAGTFER